RPASQGRHELTFKVSPHAGQSGVFYSDPPHGSEKHRTALIECCLFPPNTPFTAATRTCPIPVATALISVPARRASASPRIPPRARVRPRPGSLPCHDALLALRGPTYHEVPPAW